MSKAALNNGRGEVGGGENPQAAVKDVGPVAPLEPAFNVLVSSTMLTPTL